MANIITRELFEREYQPGLDLVINYMLEDKIAKANLQYPKLFNVEKKGKGMYTEEWGLHGLPRFQQKVVGGMPTLASPVAGYYKKYTYNTFAQYIEIEEEAVEDDLYSNFQNLARYMVPAWYDCLEYEHFKLFNYADATTYYAGGDAFALQYNSHLWSADSAQTYDTDGSTLALSSTNLETICAAIRNTKNAVGTPLFGMIPKYGISGVGLAGQWERILHSTLIPELSTNATNAVRTLYNISPIVSPYITSTTQWIIQCGTHYLRSFPRVDLQTRTEIAPLTGNLRYVGRGRFVLGFNVAAGNFVMTGS